MFLHLLGKIETSNNLVFLPVRFSKKLFGREESRGVKENRLLLGQKKGNGHSEEPMASTIKVEIPTKDADSSEESLRQGSNLREAIEGSQTCGLTEESFFGSKQKGIFRSNREGRGSRGPGGGSYPTIKKKRTKG